MTSFVNVLDDVSILETAAENLLNLKKDSHEQDDVDFVVSQSIPTLVEEKVASITSPYNPCASIECRGLKRKSEELNKASSNDFKGINVIRMTDDRWKCNICTEAFFDTWVEACMHESSCSRCTSVVTSPSLENALRQDAGSDSNQKSIAISLVPDDRNLLSEYNFLLTHHVEFFVIETKYGSSVGVQDFDISDLPTKKYGLRCVHCSSNKTCTSTACTFFPSSIGSIASGLGTIGARHLSAGKCAFLSASALEELLITRKKSQQQSRLQGKVGLDQYFRDLARRYNITDQGEGGIKIEDAFLGVEQRLERRLNDEAMLERSSQPSNDEVSVYVEDHEYDVSAFIQGDIEHFWVCRYCKLLPILWRASGSVIFSASNPSISMMKKHLSLCQGTKPLTIPRNAVLESTDDCDNKYSVRIHWDNDMNENRKSNRLQLPRSSSHEDGSDNLHATVGMTDDIYEGVEDIPLALPDDEDLTTDFAFYTIKQLKKCYLTKSGGSRGSCPLGYAGLACCHCAGSTNERRFFYTSSDHLRNSFSHIPAHILTCSLCPDEVKTRMEELKCIRNKQKSLLKVGLHKIFMDRVWERLHGPGGGVILEPTHHNGVYDDETIETGPVDMMGITNFAWCEPEIDMSSCLFINQADRNSTTDYTLYSLLQLTPNIRVSNYSEDVALVSKEDILKDITKITLYCKHCMNHTDPMTFDMNCCDDLRNAFPDIPDHLLLCQYCPDDIKSKLRLFKSLRASQEVIIKYASHKEFIKNVWERITSLVREPESSGTGASDDDHLILESALVSENDRVLVSDYTFFTMLQMKPCYLDRTGNGARSMFEHGFPGLACIHCADSASPRTFFYRTAEILSGNYAHIPNHLLSCKHCPGSIKSLLHEKKRVHMTQKVGLNRGSQRQFFNNVWERLHHRKISSCS